MSARNVDGMKGAFQALRVNQPLRLPKDGPGLSPPIQNAIEASRKEAPLSEVPSTQSPKSEAASIQSAPMEATQNEQPRIESAAKRSNALDGTEVQLPHLEVPENKDARGDVPQSEATPTKVPREECAHSEQPQIEVSRLKSAQSRHAHEEAPRREPSRNDCPQNEVTQNERSDPRPARPAGFFRLSQAIFWEAEVREMSGDCFRVFLWMSARAWRYPDSTGVLRAAVSFIESETGMGHATVSRALKSLKEARLIKTLEVDYKRGNVWKVSPIAVAGSSPEPEPKKKMPRGEVPQSEAAHLVTEAPSNRGRTSLESGAEAPQIEQQYKKCKNQKNFKEARQIFPERSGKNGNRDTAEEEFQLSCRAALEAFVSELTAKAQSEFLADFIESEYPHGFTPPSLVLKSLAALAWVERRSA